MDIVVRNAASGPLVHKVKQKARQARRIGRNYPSGTNRGRTSATAEKIQTHVGRRISAFAV